MAAAARQMRSSAIYALLSCRDLSRSRSWFEALFGRPCDAEPMAGLVEWHHAGMAGLQLLEDAARAGRGMATLIVANLMVERDRLQEGGLDIATIERGDAVNLMTLEDPDGNRVVLVEVRGAADG